MIEFSRLVSDINKLFRMVNDLDRRVNNVVREGDITEVKGGNAYVVNANGIETDPLPLLQRSGGINEHRPATVKQRVVVLSPNGDMKRGAILPAGYTDENQQPDNATDSDVTTIGDMTFKFGPDGLTISSNGVSVNIGPSGITQTGGEIKHNNKDIGSTHTHSGVTPGPSPTGTPT